MAANDPLQPVAVPTLQGQVTECSGHSGIGVGQATIVFIDQHVQEGFFRVHVMATSTSIRRSSTQSRPTRPSVCSWSIRADARHCDHAMTSARSCNRQCSDRGRPLHWRIDTLATHDLYERRTGTCEANALLQSLIGTPTCPARPIRPRESIATPKACR